MGTPVEFEAWYRSELRRVVALAYALTGSRAASEELAQEAFLKALREWDRIAGYDDPSAWVRRVVVNQSRSWGRRRMAETRALMRLSGRRALPDELPPDASAFWSAVRSLPSGQAQAAALFYAEDRSTADIAAILGVSEGTVKTHLSRARAALAQRFEQSIPADRATEVAR
ncbi:MAG: RNA polymerase sigma factor [Acidimicrobiia bacterium]